jgi:hypothetical protein
VSSRSQHSTGLYVRSERGLRFRDDKVRRLVRRMRNAIPWLTDADIPACRSWAQIEILAGKAFAVLQTAGIVNDENEPRRLLGDFRARSQAEYARFRELVEARPRSVLNLKNSGTGRKREVILRPVRKFQSVKDSFSRSDS